MKEKAHKRRVPEEQRKKIKACVYYVFGGMTAKNNIARAFVATPLTPFPNITAPIYSPGNIPASPNTEAWHIPLTAPNKNKRQKQLQKRDASSLNPSAKNGRMTVIMASNMNIIWTFTLSDKF